jgi:hypothetical protein
MNIKKINLKGVGDNDGYFEYTFPIIKSELQKKLERQGCAFKGQELLANHEADPEKPCYCGRPNEYNSD